MMNNLESILTENRVFPPNPAFAAHARIGSRAAYDALVAEAAADYEGFWARLAREFVSWDKPFSTVLDAADAPHYRWFTDGTLNASVNCIDRHLPAKAQKIAFIAEADDGRVREITYQQLHDDVARLANGLKSLGITKGDRVIIYMPMIPEASVAMLACARIGAIHSVVFGGFSAEALRDRMNDTGARLVITADGGLRGGRAVPLKAAVDKALEAGCPTVEKVVVFERIGQATLADGRDVSWRALCQDQAADCPPVMVEAEHPLFLLYTSGSTGKPKGVQHATGGFMVNAAITNAWVFDLNDNDVYWCTADVGWITGHSYVTYGPLALGVTQVIFEGIPSYPDGGRFWQMIERHKVSVFYTAPTAIRALMKLGDELPAQSDLSSLRLLGTVGEPINPEAWMWYHRVIGAERCPIADTWWQTETGAHMIAPLPGAIATKPGSCTLPLPGIMAAIVNDDGEAVGPNQGGNLVITKPWPSMIRTIWGDDARFVRSYFPEKLKGYYLAGDSARRDDAGYFWIMGRIDDVLNVSGHRLGTMEIESALVAHPMVAEAAVVGKPHDIKGESIMAFVVCKGERPEGAAADAMIKTLRDWVAEQIGPIAKPDDIRFGDNLPKTRSGKIMRRLLRGIAVGELPHGDVSTLENPAILAQLLGK
ncbi:MAG: acetate--CoA ligase [Halothiobacillus sp. 24-54-40]|jgi:acetyl-CoA synthetase|nr:MAG: acetate--CoA ligase [Halothiobacillus sp. 35-54-62]OYZ86835.1 MAG: acetate--CoA ligase [Halothiobacillus sp. 24-54-40]OZA81009.1 MAG: acetate--CoA ligase [Halothiobacillus sp. 39-53-45]HQS02522.1 acetate--CoA ligase [Halothiobacillus sp.]HQS29045.1 acetate--CoA ligase [Halothiobacillus sp.]